MTAAVEDPLKRAQLAAIDESGWGRAFKFVQVHNAAFWVYVLVTAFGVIALVREYAPVLPVYWWALIAAVAVFAVYTIPFWLYIRYSDRYEREPARLVIVAFMWGAICASYGLSLEANRAGDVLFAKWFGNAWTEEWSAGVGPPLIEELAKGAGLVLIIAMAPRLVRSAYDGAVLGAFVGLGFQVSENILYAYTNAVSHFGADQGAAVLEVLGYRGATGILSHTLYSAVFGMGLVWFFGRPTEPRRRARGAAFMGFAILSHGALNVVSAFRDRPALAVVLVTAITVADIGVLVVGLRWAATRERGWMHDVMAPEVAGGVINQAELDVLSGGRAERRAYLRAANGLRGRARARRLLRAAMRLADEIGRAGGAESLRVERARSEVARART